MQLRRPKSVVEITKVLLRMVTIQLLTTFQANSKNLVLVKTFCGKKSKLYSSTSSMHCMNSFHYCIRKEVKELNTLLKQHICFACNMFVHLKHL